MLRIISKKISNFQNSFRCMSIKTKSLKFNQFGEPDKVLYICEDKISEPTGDEVLLKILAAPINPADINTIQGKYPVKPPFPAIGGNECVAEVVSTGPNVCEYKTGDLVIPNASGAGTWTTYAKFDKKALMLVPKGVPIAEAATLSVNPGTAYRMLKDFKDLQYGDTIIQNGANSAVGQAVHQLCNVWGISSIGIVRNRPDIESLKRKLKILGATEILTEDELRTTELFKGPYKKPILALNCIGGKNSTELARHLDNKGAMVTYGGMSREPILVPTAALIFKDISFHGFWMTRWTKENFNSPKRKEMFDKLCSLISCRALTAPPHEMVSIDEYKEAVTAAFNPIGFSGKKYIFTMKIEE